jgi:predicted metal-dependent phosphoesterase TrpH
MTESTILAEFHCHSIFSKDSLQTPAKLVAACRKLGIGRVVVTDHNSISGALEAQRLAPDLVIVGEEIMTTAGEILASFVSEEIPGNLEPLEVISRLKAQGAFISVSHPLDRVRSGAWKLADLDRIIDQVDAIEIFNSRCWYAEDNDRAAEYAVSHHLPGTAGSDAHASFEMGSGLLRIAPFLTADELREKIRIATVVGKKSPNWVHLVSRWAVMRKKIFRP